MSKIEGQAVSIHGEKKRQSQMWIKFLSNGFFIPFLCDKIKAVQMLCGRVMVTERKCSKS